MEKKPEPTCECVSFCKLAEGCKGKIVQIDPESPFAERLRELGLISGTELEVVKVAPFGDPVEVCFRGQSICLRKSEAACIQVAMESQDRPRD